MKQPGSRNQQSSGTPKPLLGMKMEDDKDGGRWNSKEKEREKRKGGVGLSKRGHGLLVEVLRDLRGGLFK